MAPDGRTAAVACADGRLLTVALAGEPVITQIALGAPAQLGELGRRARAPAPRRELGPEDEGHRDQAALAADGAGLLGRAPHVAGGPEQLGVGVADVDLHGAAPFDVPDQAVAHQAVLDAGRDVGTDCS